MAEIAYDLKANYSSSLLDLHSSSDAEEAEDNAAMSTKHGEDC